MKGIKKGLAILLVLCTLLSLVFVAGAAPMPQSADADQVQATAANDGYKIVHLDCGRKYFTKDWIIALVNEMAADGYNQLELAFGNDGLRFLLNDMSFTANGANYTHDAVVSAVEAGNIAQNDSGDGSWLTQAYMDEIIDAANAKGIEIVPLLNLPGHANAILDIAGDAYNVTGSQNTLDMSNDAAVNFAMAIFQKYVDYFAAKGCKFFNFGADEYANDIKGGLFSFNRLDDKGYTKFVEFVNGMASYIKDKDMIPRAFNDGMYYQGKTSSVDLDTAIQCCYWSCGGWGGYVPAAATTVANKGHTMINTHGDYYYVLGKDDAFTPEETTTHDASLYTAAARFNNTTFMGGTISNPAGSMFCIWCDFPNAETEQTIAANTRMTLRAMSARMDGEGIDNLSTAVVPGGFNATGTINDGTSTPDPGYKEEPITLTVGGTYTRTVPDVNYENNVNRTELDESIATVEVTGTDEVEATTTYTQVTSNPSWESLISSDGGPNSTDYHYLKDGAYYQLYVSCSTKSGSFPDRTYTLGYYANGNTWTEVDRKTISRFITWPDAGSVSSSVTMYTKSPTELVPASTTVTFTGKAVGTTYVTVGDTRYTITVTEEDLSAVAPLTVEYWITNSRLTASDDANSVTINAADKDVHSETGVNIADLAASTASKDNRTQEYWQAKILDTAKANSSTSGTEKQTGDSGDDETLSGAAFTKVRYWGGKWQVFTTDWVNVEKQHQLVAYYMEVININNANGESELHANAADWGTKGDGSGDWGYTPESSRCSVSVQIVYEDATTNPADTTANALKTKTIVYAYWNGGRGLGTMIFNGQENYEIYKVTAETGDMTSSTNGRYVTVTGFTWDRNEETVWEGDATQSVSIGNPTRKPNYEAPYDNLAWDTSSHNKNNAILIRVYVKAVATKDSLTVHYIDKTANIEFYDYNITVASGTIFDEGFALSNGKLVNNTVINTNGVTQTVQSDLSTMPEIAAQYRGRDYTCAEVKRNDDGKDVYLYYTFNDVKSFVIDFGLPVNITMEKLGIDSSAWTSATVSNAKYGNATASIQDGVTYTPTQTLKGAEALTVTLANESESITQQIYIYPATTVYYEESFGTFPAGSITGAPKADNQAAEAAGDKTNNYGYDAAYLNNTQDSNGTVATLNAGEQGTFTFTGTGVDVYACTKTDSGKVMIYVYSGSGDDKTLTRLITVDTRQFGEQSAKDTAYNVPIVSLSGLDYGEYTLVMKEVQTKLDNNSKENYPVYIDGFRVHGTLDVVNTQVYKDDNEANPTFVELRNSVLNAVIGNTDPDSIYADQIANKTMSQVYAAKEEGVSALIVTKDTSSALEGVVVKDLLDNGPKNEIYLKQNESLVFTANATSAQIGLKALNGATTYTINNGAQVDLITSTDMFYSISTDTVVITNTGSGILSITELKLFGAGTSTASVEPMSAPALTRALKSLGFESEPVAATATLNITVQCGDKAVPVTLTADGMSGDTHTFTAAEIKAAVEQALPEGYNVDDVTFSDVTVACGESTDVSFAAAQTQTPDAPTSIIGKIVSIAKKIIHKIISWF